MQMYRRFFKMILDPLVALALLAILAPFLLIVALLVRLDSPGNVLFLQDRLGRGGRVFKLRKFRTMTDVPRVVDGEIYNGVHADVTRVGAWLRRFKIDELPQLWNVVIGDMSLVGPRPCMPEQLDALNDDGRVRLLVRPGLTGLAQVNGNIFLSWPERWVFDRQYVENLTLRMDLAIAVRTLRVVLSGERRMQAD
jgi:lipopolysaccharide/colanic/teichoic acid biosynthesis glycosyltransferase